jgi:hypothetical protein
MDHLMRPKKPYTDNDRLLIPQVAVQSYRFNNYVSFKKDCENMGWEYLHSFAPFKEITTVNCSCLFFTCGWMKATRNLDTAELKFQAYSKPMFSFSNPASVRVYDLDKEYDNALIAVWETMKEIQDLPPSELMKEMEMDLLYQPYEAFSDFYDEL